MANTPIFNLVYGSSAVRELEEGDLVALLRQSREKNARLGITGLLLYKDGNFIQALEGPEAAVRGLYRSICGDGRHRGVLRLLERHMETRQFPDWAMGFADLKDPSVRDLPGYSEFMDEPFESGRLRAEPDAVLTLLKVFRRNMNR